MTPSNERFTPPSASPASSRPALPAFRLLGTAALGLGVLGLSCSGLVASKARDGGGMLAAMILGVPAAALVLLGVFLRSGRGSPQKVVLGLFVAVMAFALWFSGVLGPAPDVASFR